MREGAAATGRRLAASISAGSLWRSSTSHLRWRSYLVRVRVRAIARGRGRGRVRVRVRVRVKVRVRVRVSTWSSRRRSATARR